MENKEIKKKKKKESIIYWLISYDIYETRYTVYLIYALEIFVLVLFLMDGRSNILTNLNASYILHIFWQTQCIKYVDT